jgi:hypothetical protein
VPWTWPLRPSQWVDALQLLAGFLWTNVFGLEWLLGFGLVQRAWAL